MVILAEPELGIRIGPLPGVGVPGPPMPPPQDRSGLSFWLTKEKKEQESEEVKQE